MKIILKLLMIIIVAAFLVASLMRTTGKSSDQVCTGVEVHMEDSLGIGMIDTVEVKALLQEHNMTFENRKTSEINLGILENSLSQSPYIDTAFASFNAAGKLILTVVPRMPALHIMPTNGEDYYLDRNGISMPVGRLKGNLVPVTGEFSKEFAQQKLIQLGRCIQDSTFWRLQVQQIDVRNEHDVRMYTRIADHVILLGDVENIPDKLHRLRVFYQQGLPQTGWNKYESLNVTFDGMVIGTKSSKGNKKTK